MFNPKYKITDKLLANIKKIGILTAELNSVKYPRTVLMKLEREARIVSSFASTSIEGNPLPLTDVKIILKNRPENIRNSEQEVLNYNEALVWLGNYTSKIKQAFETDLVFKIHSKVMDKLVSLESLGKFRSDPVFVNDPKIGKTVYWPPDAKNVGNLMIDLFEFVKTSESTDPLILAGIFHKQFVIIHPFMDGNGRTVRLMTKVILARMGLDTFSLFSFENYYNKNVTKYFQMVGEYGNYYDLSGKIDYTVWLEYFTEGIIDELVRVKKELELVSLTPEKKLKPFHREIIGYLDKNGFIRDADYAGITKRAKATRTLDFKKLQDLGLIKRFGKGRATYYKLI
ncbi:Fic family protein [Candidatus Microgenomates bacterium]|nr:Fic family protein [Candidatus Microgenomates bacterium]